MEVIVETIDAKPEPAILEGDAKGSPKTPGLGIMVWAVVRDACLAGLLWILSPILWVLKKVATYYILFWVRTFGDKRISPRAKCPSCGCRKKHKIQFSRVYNAILHQCVQCGAEWGVDPIYPVGKWLLQEAKDDEKQKPLWKV